MTESSLNLFLFCSWLLLLRCVCSSFITHTKKKNNWNVLSNLHILIVIDFFVACYFSCVIFRNGTNERKTRANSITNNLIHLEIATLLLVATGELAIVWKWAILININVFFSPLVFLFYCFIYAEKHNIKLNRRENRRNKSQLSDKIAEITLA